MTTFLALAFKHWRILVALALAGALWFAYMHWRDVQRGIGDAAATARYNAAIEIQKEQARKELEDGRMRVEKAEGAAAAAKQTQDLKDSQNAKTVAYLERKLFLAGRLRDPYATPHRCGPGGDGARPESAASADDSGNDAAETSGLLSERFSDLLRARAQAADEINIAYISSREDAARLRGLLAACTK